ncbi:endonuclease/exonuclease/phosphatase family protein [Nocardioides marinus]|uniref:Endonuclease/exonuclease/phosphatase family metal-dependent hydrolase n=1 Tax=Nocardioides marinus TaxID=374514 RepID=A0A7Y9YE53_9ACTN|nr:endonuclease/exonuclease/phosphatase family protein [Nocardioides marinus]NYI09317.1 endonuclease/exonuclease/phosphatase family metal-dependent hydrolase [Nocardioides marinus]
MDGPRRPWLEAIGLVLVLSLAATAFFVSRQPTRTQPVTAPGQSTATPGARPAQDVVTGGDPIEGTTGKQGRGSSGTAALPKPQRLPGGLPKRASSCVVSTESSLEVATFNIHSGWNRGRSRQMLPQIAREMAALDVDVWLLQEVDKNRVWSGRVDQAAYLAGQLGMEYAFATNVLRPGESRYGTAVLSAYPIKESSNTLLPRPAGTQQRGLLRVVVEPLPGQRVSLFTTHFEHTSQDARLTQARTVAQVLADDPHRVVLGGDLNARPASPPITTLRGVAADTWATAGRGAGLTHPSANPRSRIDYLMHRGQLGVNVVSTHPSRVSDHRVVRASYDLTPGVPDEIVVPLIC